jgi:Polysaccharide pyruvyl transferase
LVYKELIMRILVAGWFSFEQGHATAGDLLARDVVCDWLTGAGYRFDIATAPPFTGGVDVRTVEAKQYSHLIVVCGPFEQGRLEKLLIRRFWHCRLIGLNLSMRTPLNEWNPFDYLIERDSSVGWHSDLVFASVQPSVPVVGVCLVEDYPQGDTRVANAAVERLIQAESAAVIRIDTRLDLNSAGLRNPREIEALIARVDVLITTRLHGMVFALKNGVPPLVIDPEPAGLAKIRRQARLIGWPVVFDTSSLVDHVLQESYQFCLSPRAREQARECGRGAALMAATLEKDFLTAIEAGAVVDVEYQARMHSTPKFVDWDPTIIPSRPRLGRLRKLLGFLPKSTKSIVRRMYHWAQDAKRGL